MDSRAKQTVLVTGANGFVGRRLCDELVRQGHDVRLGVRTPQSGLGMRGEIFALGDLMAPTGIGAAVAGADTVVHLAARVHVMRETALDPLATFRGINAGATEALARAAVGGGVKRFVYLSSIKVNGELTGDEPFSPDDPPAPDDAYGISKHEAERALWSIAASSGLEVTVVRPPLVYGPGVGGNFLRLLRLVQRGIPLPFGSVKNRRSMIYNGNLADALIACAVHPAAAGQTFLVSDSHDMSTPELIAQLAESMGRRSPLVPCPVALLKAGGRIAGKTAELERLVGSLRVDNRRMHEILGWQPPFTVAEGLAETVRWFQGHRSG